LWSLADAGTISEAEGFANELANLECGVALWRFGGGDHRRFGESFDDRGV
jgi:hypothetical protein